MALSEMEAFLSAAVAESTETGLFDARLASYDGWEARSRKMRRKARIGNGEHSRDEDTIREAK